MKISVIGCGAMGSIYAGYLADAGNEVIAIDTWKEHLFEINKNGLTIEGPNNKKIIKNIKASNNFALAQGSDLFIIATKTSQVRNATKNLSKFTNNLSPVLTIQNGLGSGENVAQYIKKTNIILGVADGFGASIIEPGHIHHNAMNLIRLGEMEPRDMYRVNEISQVWSKAGFTTKTFEDINQLVWEKFICNVTFSAPCTVYDCTLGELMATPSLWAVALGCMREAYELGLKKGIKFSFSDPVKYVTQFGLSMQNARPSMLLDHKERRLSEIDSINGMVCSMGTELEFSTPYNQALVSIIRSWEKKMENR